jgi:drug/metabolite transporter (DMT)-like permease
MVAVNNYTHGIIEMVLTAMIWGSVSLFAIWSGFPSPVFVFFRVVFAIPFLALFVVLRYGFSGLLVKEDVVPITLSGIMLALNWVLLFYAVTITTVASAVLMYYIGPVIAIALSPLILKEKLPRWISIPTSVALLGAFIILYQGLENNGNFIGSLMGFGAGASYGSLAVTSKLATRRNSPIKVVLYQVGISTIILLPFITRIAFTLLIDKLMMVIIAGVVHTAFALALWYDALKKIPIYVASILSYLDPIFATLFAYVFLQQVPTTATLLGGGMIITAGIVTVLGQNQYSSY